MATVTWEGSARELFASSVLAIAWLPVEARWRALRRLGYSVEKSSLYSHITIRGRGRLHIGREAFISHGVLLDTTGDVEIGARTSIATGTAIITSTHRTGSRYRRAGSQTAQPVVIGEGVWIGAYARILPGVKIGSGTIIAAGAVVVDDCETNALYAGVPATLKRRLA